MKTLLLQARRPDDPMRAHEYECFLETTGLTSDQLATYNLVEGIPSLSHVREHNALLIGGSGEFYVSKRDLPRFDELLELLAAVAECGHPMFGSCFGYHCLVAALGGEIINDPDNTEVGTYELTRTEASNSDPLFGALPGTFMAQLGHKDRAKFHPPNCGNFASSEHSPLQALRVPGKPIWAVQFHPELTGTRNKERYRHYLEGYTEHLNEQEKQAQMQRFKPSPEATSLLSRFLDYIECG